ncbi:MAG TPA: hypothetical protein VIC06_00930 [Solirubrobacteraceae bacterium]|jgi:Zn-dependent protease with chaperone function
MQGSNEFELKCLSLYALTVALEVPAMLARYVAGLTAAWILMRMGGHDNGSASDWAKLAALGPIAWSALALLTPQGGGWWWRQRLGGRPPSQRERESFQDALGRLRARTRTPLPTPESWFVLDDPRCEAAVYGHTLMLSKGALELPSAHLSALLAHELGHLRNLDAKLTVAVNRLMLKPFDPIVPPAASDRERRPQSPASPPHTPRTPAPPPHTPQTPTRRPSLIGWAARGALSLLRGGLGLRLSAPSWGALWREQEYRADSWAASIGWASELADFLEERVLELDHPIPLVGLTAHTHPPTELRIDRLRNSTGPQEPKPPSESESAWIGGPVHHKGMAP